MTNITELAQREKFEAWWEREYKHLESSKYTDAVPHIKYGFWMAYQAGGAELVEALEKAEQQIIALQQRHEVDPRTHEIIDLKERITELESEVEKWKQESEAWEQVAEKQLSTAIELESRTVKLPEPFELAKVSGGLSYHYADEVDAALIVAGIKVEAE
ncbi:Uncharacterised protein [Klebsiella pneumoniae]|uniref:hypothetical protein n=1 Tax=Klebsiella pneumoniae TaxID=573 RepID=UPI00108397A2|nr:hypothetical protein [Klebsiella pneumoniae]VFZ94077.1 Uncharacterised protein [Klebsiella pneumoniae]VGA27337.1 Uncharacterised protein [Klebsiella pneumoniae]